MERQLVEALKIGTYKRVGCMMKNTARFSTIEVLFLGHCSCSKDFNQYCAGAIIEKGNLIGSTSQAYEIGCNDKSYGLKER